MAASVREVIEASKKGVQSRIEVLIQVSVSGYYYTCLVPLEIQLAAFMSARAARTSVIGPSISDLLAWTTNFRHGSIRCRVQNAKVLEVTRG